MPAADSAPRALAWMLLGTALLLLVAPMAAQEVTVEVRDLIDEESGIKLLVAPVLPTRTKLVEEKSLESKETAPAGPYQIYYDYQENLLTPYPDAKCYIQVWVVDPRQQTGVPEGQVKTWYQKLRLTVEGTFLDGSFELPIKVSSGDREATGKIRVVAHRADPAAALSLPGSPPPRLLMVPPRSFKIGVRNHTRCAIVLGKPAVTTDDDGLWASPPELVVNSALVDGSGDNQLTLRLAPRSWPAFLKSFIPYDSGKPNAALQLQVPFEVRGGHQGVLSEEVLIQFQPRDDFLLLSLVLGAVLTLGVMLLASKQERAKILANAKTRGATALAISRRLVLAVVVSFIVYVIFRLLRGKVGVFDVSLDPQNYASAFIIGVLVGRNPTFFLDWIANWITKKKNSTGPGASGAGRATSLVLALLLASAVLQASDFSPIGLAYRPDTEEIYVLTSQNNEVFRLDPQRKNMKKLRLQHVDGYASDLCLARQGQKSWLASIASRPAGSASTWRISVSLDGLEPNTKGYQRPGLGFGRFSSIAFDPTQSRLILSDQERGAIYAMAVGPDGLGKEKLLFKESSIREPISVLALEGKLYVGDASRESVLELDLATRKVRKLVEDVNEPLGLAAAPDRSALFVVDPARGEVLRYDFRSGRTSKFAEKTPFEEPAAIVADRNRHVWVADRAAGWVFELGEDGSLLGRHAPR